MFFSSPSLDLKVIVFMLCFAFVISVITYLMSKNFLAAIFLMSLLSNLSIYLNSGSELFDIYPIKWIVIFTLDFWPYINVFLFLLIIFKYFKNKNFKKMNTQSQGFV